MGEEILIESINKFLSRLFGFLFLESQKSLGKVKEILFSKLGFASNSNSYSFFSGYSASTEKSSIWSSLTVTIILANSSPARLPVALIFAT